MNKRLFSWPVPIYQVGLICLWVFGRGIIVKCEHGMQGVPVFLQTFCILSNLKSKIVHNSHISLIWKKKDATDSAKLYFEVQWVLCFKEALKTMLRKHDIFTFSSAPFIRQKRPLHACASLCKLIDWCLSILSKLRKTFPCSKSYEKHNHFETIFRAWTGCRMQLSMLRSNTNVWKKISQIQSTAHAYMECWVVFAQTKKYDVLGYSRPQLVKKYP